MSRPLYVQVHPDDNVAIVVNEGGLRAVQGLIPAWCSAKTFQEAHKVALSDIPAGAPIVRYGRSSASRARNHEGKLGPRGKDASAECAGPGQPSACTNAPEPLPPLEGYSFQDSSMKTAPSDQEHPWHHHNGSVCRRNGGLRGQAYPKGDSSSLSNVDDVIALTHNYGCGSRSMLRTQRSRFARCEI